MSLRAARAGLSTEFVVPRYWPASPAGPRPPRPAGGAPPPRPDVHDPEEIAFHQGPHGIVGADDRVEIADPTAAPWRHICALRISTRTGAKYVGTGWLIGPRAVMTAGHCLELRNGDEVVSVEVIPALQGTSRPYGAVPATRFEVMDGWKNAGDEAHDCGAIFTDTDVLSRAGAFGFAAADQRLLWRARINIAGYPRDKSNATRLYFHGRQVASFAGRTMQYRTDTFGGQSGSPIWITLHGEHIAVGVHTRGSSERNSGVVIDDEVFDKMAEWRARGGG